jgi:ComF family protein
MVACIKHFTMQLLTFVLDWCFPPRASERIVRSLTIEALRPTPSYPRPDTTCLLPYQSPYTHALIHEAKYHYNRQAHNLLGHLTAQYIHEHYPAAILIPIPLHPRRERERGFNQVTASLTTSPLLRAQLTPSVLVRTRYTQPQTHLSAGKRRKNVRDAFVVTQPYLSISSNKCILLIDDVYTTGATMNAARTAVRAAFPHHHVYGLTFAYA